MTPSNLKYHHEDCYELRGKKPVKEGLQYATYFDKVTFEIRRDLGRKR